LGLAVLDRFDAWRDERLETLERRLWEVATLASAGKLPEALITEAGVDLAFPKALSASGSRIPAESMASFQPS
jgi:hypothetical protein